MKNSAKIGLIVALFSILGAGTFIKAVHATQIPNLVESVKSLVSRIFRAGSKIKN
jgi:hypothetical protein